MSSDSDSDHTSSIYRRSHKRKVISDSDSSDSIIVQRRRKKKIYVCIKIFIIKSLMLNFAYFSNNH
jgi:hypothetical protein